MGLYQQEKSQDTYQLNCMSLVPQDSGSNASKSRSQAVASCDESVAWILGNRRVDLRAHRAGNRLPGAPEASMDLTSGTETAAIDHARIQISHPVAEIAAATESQDDQLIGVVNCDVTSGVAERIAPVDSMLAITSDDPISVSFKTYSLKS